MVYLLSYNLISLGEMKNKKFYILINGDVNVYTKRNEKDILND